MVFNMIKRMRSFLECWSRSLHKRVPGFSFGMLRFNEQYITVKKRWYNRLNCHIPPSPDDFCFAFSRWIRHFRIFFWNFYKKRTIFSFHTKGEPWNSIMKAATYWQVPKSTASTPPLPLLYKLSYLNKLSFCVLPYYFTPE